MYADEKVHVCVWVCVCICVCESSPCPRRDRCSSADRLTVCVAIVADGHPADVRGLDNPVGPETKPEGSYCQCPV